jgi:hypothetical protein
MKGKGCDPHHRRLNRTPEPRAASTAAAVARCRFDAVADVYFLGHNVAILGRPPRPHRTATGRRTPELSRKQAHFFPATHDFSRKFAIFKE